MNIKEGLTALRQAGYVRGWVEGGCMVIFRGDTMEVRHYHVVGQCLDTIPFGPVEAGTVILFGPILMRDGCAWPFKAA